MRPKIYLNNHFGISPNDTALCNRIYWWEIAQEINKKHDYCFDIMADSYHYKDLVTHLELPNTVIYTKDKYLIHSAETPLDKMNDISFNNMIDVITKEKKLDINKDYKLNFEFWIMDKDIADTIEKRQIHRITLKDEELNKIMMDSSNYVGIHIRRNNGVTVKREHILSMPPYLQAKYRKLVFDNPNRDEGYLFYPDSVYFRIIDKILTINPNQKFYISHDLEEEYFIHWKEKYPELIFTRQNFIDESDIDDVDLINLFDLFFLSNTEYMLASPSSSWSRFAYEYKNKFWNNITDPDDYIIDTYEKYNSKNRTFKKKLDID